MLKYSNNNNFENINFSQGKFSRDGTFKGIKLYGKVQVVDDFPDIRIQVVDYFPDLKVQKVDYFPDSLGKWQFVEENNFPDFTIKYVDQFPDITIKFVDYFPGFPETQYYNNI